MAEIRPFKGIRYNSKVVKLEEVITEPYDRIPPSLQEEYYRRSPFNVVRIILGKEIEPENPEQDKYKRAKLYLEEWMRKGVLIREEKESLYLYEQEFRVDKAWKKRKGLVARVKLEEFSSKKVLPHEKTFPKHKEDRLNLLRATNTNTEQIFLLYKDEEQRVSQAIEDSLQRASLVAEVGDEDNIFHRLWIISDEEDIERIQDGMRDKVLIIADGHHRYETSLNFRKETIQKMKTIKGDEPFQYVMMTLFDFDDPGLVILPTHRLLRGVDRLTEESLRKVLTPYFEIEEIEWTDLSNKSSVSLALEKINSGSHVFAGISSEFRKIFIFRLKSEKILNEEMDPQKPTEWKKLDVSILHSLILDKLASLCSQPLSLEGQVGYIREVEEGIRKIVEGEFQMLFLLKAVTLPELKSVIEKGELMPHKSTDFFPKLKSGLIMNPLND